MPDHKLCFLKWILIFSNQKGSLSFNLNAYDETALWKNLSDLYNSFVDQYEYFDAQTHILVDSLNKDQNYTEAFEKMNTDLSERFE